MSYSIRSNFPRLGSSSKKKERASKSIKQPQKGKTSHQFAKLSSQVIMLDASVVSTTITRISCHHNKTQSGTAKIDGNRIKVWREVGQNYWRTGT